MPYIVGRKVGVVHPDDCPPWFEVEFEDARGEQWRVVDKEPIFGYPAGGGSSDEVHIQCAVLRSADGVSTVRLDWGVATAAEVSIFEVATAAVHAD